MHRFRIRGRTRHTPGTTTAVTILVTTHDPDDAPPDIDDNDAPCGVAVTPSGPRRGGGAAATPVNDLDALGVFADDGGMTVVKNGVLVTWARFGTLDDDGRVLWIIDNAALLPTWDPRPGDEGA